MNALPLSRSKMNCFPTILNREKMQKSFIMLIKKQHNENRYATGMSQHRQKIQFFSKSISPLLIKVVHDF